MRVCHPNADTYVNHSPKQIYKVREQEKKRQYATRVLEIEKGTFTPLAFTTTGGMGDRYHRRLAELLAMKKGEDYPKTMNWIRVKIACSLIRSALVCLRGWKLILMFRQLKTVLEVRGLKHQFCWVYRPGFFILILRHETKVGRVFIW